MKKQTPNDFNFWLPIDFMKSDATEYPRGDDRRYENMIFEGIASDDSKDYQGDSMAVSYTHLTLPTNREV